MLTVEYCPTHFLLRHNISTYYVHISNMEKIHANLNNLNTFTIETNSLNVKLILKRRWFLNLSELFSTWKFSKWIPLVIPTLFSYCIGSHSTPNCTCLWNGSPLSHDQAFKWSSSHYSVGNNYINSQVMFYALNFMKHL